MSHLTIVMYHYVRELEHSRYPELKALRTSDFIRQLDFIQQQYCVVGAEDVASACNAGRTLPENACLLTFDDGYLDHYLTVFPELLRRGLPGAFYPPVQAVNRNSVMEVNKIQLMLAHAGYANASRLLAMLKGRYEFYRKECPEELPETFASLYEMYGQPSRFDSAEVCCIKKLLQYVLPSRWRTQLINELFVEILDTDERILAKELYMSLDMLRAMAKNGMHIGSHGTKHVWLDKITEQEQDEELRSSLEMLMSIDPSEKFMWSMCYPFGANNESMRNLCAQNKCAFALTTEPRVAMLPENGPFRLPRLDTNDIALLYKQ